MNQPKPHLEGFFTRLRRRRLMRACWRVVKYGVLGLFFLLFVLWFLLQDERVQNWLSKKTTDYLSEQLQTDVHIDRIDFDFFDKLVLEGLHIADQQGDTLLHTRELKTSLSANLLGLIGKEIDVDDIELNDAYIHIHRDSAELDYNFKFLLDFLKNPKKKKKKKSSSSKPLVLDIDAIYLENVHFKLSDIRGGKFLDARVPSGHILVDRINLKETEFDIREVLLQSPDIRIEERPKVPLPFRPEVQLVGLDGSDELVVDVDSTRDTVQLWIQSFRLADGHFKLDNIRKSPISTLPENAIDFAHLDVAGIDVGFTDFYLRPDTISSELTQLNFQEQSGFQLNDLTAGEFLLTDRKVAFYGLDLETPNSQISDTLEIKYFEFADFQDFNNNVIMDVRLKGSEVAVRDLVAFVPKLAENEFFAKNKDAIFRIDGRLSGKVNSLRGRDLQIRLGQGTTFRGSFSSRNLAIRNEEALNLDVEDLRSNVRLLRQLIPNFDPPANFDKLGNVRFKGSFDGFFIDYVAYGELNTELGKAIVDMRMDLRNGRDLAEYSGRISLQDFDLRTWSGDDRFGSITFNSEVKEGQGLTLANVNAKLGASIENFAFKGYTYENLIMNGELTRNLFDGNMVIEDDNLDFVFDGTVDFSDTIPYFDFQADIRKIDIKTLNLSPKDYVMGGKLDIQLRGIKLEDLQGKLSVRDFNLLENDSVNYSVDSLDIISQLRADGSKVLDLHSEVLDVHVEGDFSVDRLPDAILKNLEDNYTQIANRFNLHPSGRPLSGSDFDYEVSIYDSKNLTKLLMPQLDTLRGVDLSGHVDLNDESLSLVWQIPQLRVGNVVFDDVDLQISGKDRVSNIELSIYHTAINKKQHFQPLTLNIGVIRDSIQFSINAINFSEVLDNLNLNGSLSFVEDYFDIRFQPSDLVILNDRWDIDADNYLRIGKKYIDTKNFVLTKDDKQIRLLSIDQKGLEANILGFDLSLIDDVWDYNKLDFGGRFDAKIQVADLFQLKGIRAEVTADTMLVNGDDWGLLNFEANMPSRNDYVKGALEISRSNRRLNASGYFVPPGNKALKSMQHRLEVDGEIKNFPLYISEYWIGGGVSNTMGEFDAQVNIYADEKPHINGTIDIRNLETTIDYLQTRYYAEKGTVRIDDNYFFDASGNTIRDSEGRTATITGGITHKYLKNLGLNATINSDEFLVLQTTKKDNSLYYGRGIVGGEIRFTGSFQQTNIAIDAESKPGSRLYIPLTDERSASEVSFIKLIDRDKQSIEVDENGSVELKGIDLSMNLSVTDQAEVYLIFDERAGDIIKGQGNGDLQIFVSRSGNFTMYGDYEISQGEYLFTWYNLVKKPFDIRQGGSIRWSGDPFNAQIDLVAGYDGLSTPLYNFILEYLNDDNIRSEARKSTTVDLIMTIRGQLQKPDIDFDIEFPNATGELRNYAESKKRVLSGDQNELNRQVFGLLVIGSFLPSSQSSLQGAESLIGINTLSELVTSQLSIYLSELLSEVFTDVEGVDLNINYNIYQANDFTIDEQNVIRTGSELELDFRLLLNDRLSFNFGGNIDWNGGLNQNNTNGAFLAGEFVVEYAITEDRRMKVRFYSLTDQTFLFGRRYKTGLGLSFRREFDSFKEFAQSLGKKK